MRSQKLSCMAQRKLLSPPQVAHIHLQRIQLADFAKKFQSGLTHIRDKGNNPVGLSVTLALHAGSEIVPMSFLLDTVGSNMRLLGDAASALEKMSLLRASGAGARYQLLGSLVYPATKKVLQSPECTLFPDDGFVPGAADQHVGVLGLREIVSLGLLSTASADGKPSSSSSLLRAESTIPSMDVKASAGNGSNPHTGLKMVLCVRTDLGMGKGKIGAQCSHAAVAVVQQMLRRGGKHQAVVDAWDRSGSAKIALKVDSEQQLVSLQRAAASKGLPYYLVRDAGHTQVEAHSMTVLAIGPAAFDDLNALTGSLKLL